jgi:hypothetical protein
MRVITQPLPCALTLEHLGAVETSGVVAGIVTPVVGENVTGVDVAVSTAPVAVDLASFTGVDVRGLRDSLGQCSRQSCGDDCERRARVCFTHLT